MYFIFKLIAYTLAIVSLVSCSKKENFSPNEEFQGYINAVVNQKKLKAQYKPILGDPLYNAYYKAEKNILISRRINSKMSQGFRIEINDVILEEENLPTILQHNAKGSPRVNFAYIDENDSLWQMNIAAPMTFRLTFDKYQNNIIYGTFDGMLYLSKNDSLKISEGKFEIDLKIY